MLEFSYVFLISYKLTLLKVVLLHGCFSYFLNCTNGTISHKASHIDFILQVTDLNTEVYPDIQKEPFVSC